MFPDPRPRPRPRHNRPRETSDERRHLEFTFFCRTGSQNFGDECSDNFSKVLQISLNNYHSDMTPVKITGIMMWNSVNSIFNKILHHLLSILKFVKFWFKFCKTIQKFLNEIKYCKEMSSISRNAENGAFLAKIRIDTAENEPRRVSFKKCVVQDPVGNRVKAEMLLSNNSSPP